MKKSEKIKAWIIKWLKNNGNGTADACNRYFHEDFYEAWGGKRKEYFYGAAPVEKAQYYLKQLYLENKLDRYIVGLPEHLSGMPNWVYVYELKD